MDKEELRRLKPELKAFLDRYVPRFGREENEAHMRRFVQGLLAGEDRRNAENIAESMAGGVVRTVQKFVSQAAWEERDVLDELRCHVAETLADADGIVNADETGFPKKGKKSVGVKRQYSGALGRVDNCQIGVFLNYCSPSLKKSPADDRRRGAGPVASSPRSAPLGRGRDLPVVQLAAGSQPRGKGIAPTPPPRRIRPPQ